MPETGLMMNRQMLKAASLNELAESAARVFAEVTTEAIKARGIAYVALSGGSTPKSIYAKLSRQEYCQSIQWDHIHFFVSDERCVALSSEDSNYGNAERLLFDKVPVSHDVLHPLANPELDAAAAALNYEKTILETVPRGSDGVPRFDLIFLGMGPDGHTASLFPGTRALGETARLVVDNFVPKVNANRITFTFSLLNAAANVVFVVAGQDKAGVVGEILGSNSTAYPSGRVRPLHGNLIWMLDEASAARLG